MTARPNVIFLTLFLTLALAARAPAQSVAPDSTSPRIATNQEASDVGKYLKP